MRFSETRLRGHAGAEECGMDALQGVENVLVVGLGVSGRSAADFLLRLGKRVAVNDICDGGPVEEAAAELSRKGAEVALGHHDPSLLDGADLVVVSPGVKSRIPLLREAESRRIPIWSEVELAWRYARGPVIAVTGTNGKTTTVRMIEWIFKQASRPARSAGNIGQPFTQVVEEAAEGQALVVEVSSFQLTYIEGFRPTVSVLLNIAEDHFDWHENLEEYMEAKSRLWLNQREGDMLVCNMDDPLCRKLSRKAPVRVAYFSRRPDRAAYTYLSEGWLVSRVSPGVSERGESRRIMRADELPLPGWHNMDNAMAAASAALYFGISPQEVGSALRRFPGLPHRIQFVAEVGGVRFYNDSKATNPHAALRALNAFDAPLVLILGGRNKGLSFEELAAALGEKGQSGGIRAIYLIGEAAEELEEALGRHAPHLAARVLPGLEEVFVELASVVREGDVVLFSPACASFDRYGNYKERGIHFQEMVENYRRERSGL
jgi:UDP-N-acetylmuramoylalanine--D-glutamate ligase